VAHAQRAEAAANARAAEAAEAHAKAAATGSFPPEGIDHLGMRVVLDVELPGIGRDERLVLEGYVAVHRSGPMGPGGKSMEGDLIGASLRGKSVAFGEVVAVESPIQRSPCQYVVEGPGKYRGSFDINGWFWLPAHDLIVFSSEPVRVEGVAAAIPPVGQKAKIVETDIALFSFSHPAGNPIGTLHSASGEILDVVPLQKHLQVPEESVPALLKK
jgi:hypothetical protein